MPRIDPGSAGVHAVQPRRRKPPKPASTPAPPITRTPFERPFTQQRAQQRHQTRQARRALPRPVIATPPVIRNPSPAQVHHAARQIATSITRAVGHTGSNRERIARRDALIDQIRTDPRLHRERRTLTHWATEQARLVNPASFRDRVKAGPPDRKVGIGVGPLNLATVNTTALAGALSRGFAAATPGLHSGSAEAQFARNALSDVRSLATAPFVGGYQLGKLGADVVTGHPGRAAAKTVRFGRGVAEQTVDTVRHPARSFLEHPILTPLTFSGIGSVGGRAAGAIARGAGSTVEAAGVRGALARAGSTTRPSIALGDDLAGGIAERRLSKDLGRAAVQRARDRSREPLLDAQGQQVRGPRGEPVVKPRSELERARLAKRRGDLLASRANLLERQGRDVASREGKVRGVRGRAAEDVAAMVAEGTITSGRNFERDLRAHVTRLKARLAQHDADVRHSGHSTVYRSETEVQRARQRVKTGEAILNNPKALARAKDIAAAGIEHGRRLVAGDVETSRAGLIDAEQAHRARLIVAAVEHMGAKHYTEAMHNAAEKAARDAGDNALADAISGRHPVRLAAHRKAAAAADEARGRAKAAQAEHARFEGRVRSLTGAQTVKRGQEAAAKGPVAVYHVSGKRFENYADAVAYAKSHGLNPRASIQRIATSAAEAKRVGELSSARRSAGAALKRRREAERQWRIAQHQLRENPMPDAEAGLRHADGQFLATKDIEAFLKSQGRDPATVAYLPSAVSRRQFHTQFRPAQGRGHLDTAKGPRTGALHARGGTEASAELLRAAGVRQSIAISKATSIDRLIGDHGMRHPAWAKAERGEKLTKTEARVVRQGGYFTGREAAEAVDRAGAQGERLVAVRAYPAKLDAETQRMVRDDAQGPASAELLGQRLLSNRFLTEDELKAGGARNVVLMNGDLVKRLEDHLKPSTQLGKFGQILNRAFRYAVLPQPRWLAGNFIEPLLVRMPGVGSGINVFGMAADLRAATRVIRTMERHPDPAVRAAAQEIRAHQFGGLLIGGRAQNIHRGLEDFPALDAQAQKVYGKVVARTPAVAQMADLSGRLLAKGGKALLAPLDTIFTVNRLGESALQRAAFGKQARREIQELTGSWWDTIRLGNKAADEAARGLVNTATQERFMHAQHELLGKYEGFNPTLRAVVQGVAPFLPWALNAARFVFWTMPAHRSAQTALLIQVNNIVSQDWQQIHEGAPPGMGLAIPTKNGGWVDFARYTPYGFSGPIAAGDLKGIPGQFIPQIRGPEKAFEGKDPFGQDLQFSTGAEPNGGNELGVALNEFVESLIPYLGNARRLQEHGETAFADSTVLGPRTKEGTSHGMSAARRVFDPLRPTYLNSTDQVVSEPATSSAPRSRREMLLERRAQLLQSRSGPSSRTQELLERRARLLGSR